MKELAFAAAVVAVAGAACAADYPVQRPSSAPLPNLPPLVWDWSGVYIGANAGGGWSDMNWNFPVTQFLGFAGNAFETRPKGGLVGGQIGINKQIGPWLFGLPWVFGIEFTGDSADLKETVLGPVPIFPQDAWTTKLTDVETLTFRFGVPLNNWLFYAKAGGASGTVNLHAVSGPISFSAVFDESNRAWGSAIGGGLEYALTQNFIVGIEYDFVRLFPDSFNGPATFTQGRAAGSNVLGGVMVGANSPFDVQSVVGRLSYKLSVPTF